jgi:hypothetical protein
MKRRYTDRKSIQYPFTLKKLPLFNYTNQNALRTKSENNLYLSGSYKDDNGDQVTNIPQSASLSTTAYDINDILLEYTIGSPITEFL